MLDIRADRIEYQAQINLVDKLYDLVLKKRRGQYKKSEWQKLLLAARYLDILGFKDNLDNDDKTQLTYIYEYLIDLVEVKGLPANPGTTVIVTPSVGLVVGGGSAGTDGVSSYLYFAWADDADGTGFTTTFDAEKPYLAFIQSTLPILTLTAAHFTGRWFAILGQAGDLSEGTIWIGSALGVPAEHVVSGDFTISTAGVGAIANNVIGNAHINSSAAIALTKLAASTANKAAAFGATGFLEAADTTLAQLNYLSTTSSNVQDQIDSKQDIITGAATSIVSSDLAISRAMVTDALGKAAAHATTTATHIGYINTLSSNAQTQIDGKISLPVGASEGDILYFDGTSWVNLNRGTTGQALYSTGTSIQWDTPTINGIPTGGTISQVLMKDSSTDFDATWHSLELADISDVSVSSTILNSLSGLTATSTELNHSVGVTSPIQDQIDTKLANSLTQNYLFIGGVSNTPIPLAPGSNGQVLQVNAGVPSWQTLAGTGTVTSVAVSGGTTGLTTAGGPISTSGTITITGTLAAASGGTGQTSYAVGDLLYASTTTALSKLADIATGNVLLSGGVSTAPAWGKVTSSHIDSTVNDLFWLRTGTTTLSGTVTVTVPTVANLKFQHDSNFIHLGDNFNGPILYASDGTNFSSLEVLADGVGTPVNQIAVSSDSATFKGVVYQDDYSSNYTLRSLTDKGYVLGAKTFTGKQTFTTAATFAGLNTGVLAGDPSSGLTNGDIWYNSTTHKFRGYQNSIAIDLGSGGSTSGWPLTGAASLTGAVTMTLGIYDVTFDSATADQNIFLSDTADPIRVGLNTATNEYSSVRATGFYHTVVDTTDTLSLTATGLSWSGTIAEVEFSQGTGDTFRFNNKVTFTSESLQAPINIDGSGDVGSVDGDIWYNVTSNKLKVRENGVDKELAHPHAIIEDVTTTTYNFVEADHYKIKRFTNVSGCTATIPLGLSTGWTVTAYRASGAGVVTLVSSGTYEGFDDDLQTEETAASIFHRGSNIHVGVGALGAIGGGGSGISGSIAITQVAFATAADTLGGDASFTWDFTNNSLNVGEARLFTVTKTINDLFLGDGAGNFTTTGTGVNVGIGNNGCLTSLTSGVANTAVGSGSSKTITTGASNVGFGANSLTSNITGSYNTAIGTSSLLSVTGNNNTALGYLAGDSITSGADNVILGYWAASNLTTGSNNVIIGASVDVQSATTSGQLSIQNIIFGQGNTATGTSISTGTIGIGMVAVASDRLSIRGTSTSDLNMALWVENSAGTRLMGVSDAANVHIGGAMGFPSGPAGVVGLGNATTTPGAIMPSTGGFLYAEAGALKWKGSSGTVTTIAPA